MYVPPFLPLDFKYTIFGVFKFSLFIMVWINSTVFEDAKYLSKCRCVTPVCSFHCFNRLVALKMRLWFSAQPQSWQVVSS
jgi:hypothetical protein